MGDKYKVDRIPICCHKLQLWGWWWAENGGLGKLIKLHYEDKQSTSAANPRVGLETSLAYLLGGGGQNRWMMVGT